MRSYITLGLISAILMVMPAVASDPALPGRPLTLTADQFDRVCQIEAQPEHTAVQDVHATYMSERELSLELTRLSDDILTGAYSIGFPTVVVILLFTASVL